jgi:hypothetical protein
MYIPISFQKNGQIGIKNSGIKDGSPSAIMEIMRYFFLKESRLTIFRILQLFWMGMEAVSGKLTPIAGR